MLNYVYLVFQEDVFTSFKNSYSFFTLHSKMFSLLFFLKKFGKRNKICTFVAQLEK